MEKLVMKCTNTTWLNQSQTLFDDKSCWVRKLLTNHALVICGHCVYYKGKPPLYNYFLWGMTA